MLPTNECRATATKFIVLEDGGKLPPPPNLSQLVDKVSVQVAGCQHKFPQLTGMLDAPGFAHSKVLHPRRCARPLGECFQSASALS